MQIISTPAGMSKEHEPVSGSRAGRVPLARCHVLPKPEESKDEHNNDDCSNQPDDIVHDAGSYLCRRERHGKRLNPEGPTLSPEVSVALPSLNPISSRSCGVGLKVDGLPVIDVDESEKMTVAVTADDLLDGDTADPEQSPHRYRLTSAKQRGRYAGPPWQEVVPL